LAGGGADHDVGEAVSTTNMTGRTRTHDVTLDEVVERLGSSPHVRGVIVTGSGAHGPLHAASDIDAYVLLDEPVASLFLVFTYVEHLPAEFYFDTFAYIEELAGRAEPIPMLTIEAAKLRWLLTGRIVFDRDGRLRELQEIVSSGERILPPTEDERYSLWFGINYNLRQTRRMLLSSDPAYQTGVDLRLLYMLSEVWTGYFTVRGQAARGEKDQARYMAERDPAYLSLFEKCLAEQDRTQRLDLYERLAARTLEPIGELWLNDSTGAQTLNSMGPESMHEALEAWESLVARPSEAESDV